MNRFFLLAVALLFAAGLAACNNRSRGSTTTDPRCPNPLGTGDACDESEAGLTCSGTVSCPCGDRPTSCMCGGSSGSFRFSCVDSCTSCATGDSGVSEARCGALYDRVQASACPYPTDSFSRADFVGQCGMLAVSEACRAEIEALISCALSAEIVCQDIGDGTRFATFPSCPELSAECTPM